MLNAILTALALLASAAAAPPEREMRSFRLYKFQQPIGVEDSIRGRGADGVTEIRVAFSFTDRRTTVPLAALLTLGADDTPLSYQAWGSTSRWSRVDDRVSVSGGSLAIEQSGKVRSEPAPPSYFLIGGYSPVAVTEALWSYWSKRGRPASIPIYPTGGAVEITRRGTDRVVDADGKEQTLERYAVAGLGWGRETIWIDAAGRLAALKAVDAEFDHFEATRDSFADALPALVASAAADGLAALAEVSGVAATRDSGPVAYVGATVVDATGAPPVRDAVVVVSDGRIVAVGPRAAVEVPAGARRVDVSGRTILPGLWDMHAHFEQVEWGPLYLAAGVTTVRDCGNELDFMRSAREAIAAGKGLGPRILLACIVDGDGPGSIGTERLREAGEIPALIERFRGAGCAQVKIYSSLDPRLIAPLAQAAHAAGLTVTGHIPNGIGAVHAVEAGLDQINHITFVMRALLPPAWDPDKRLSQAEFRRAQKEIDLESPSAKRTIALFAERKIVIDPTLALYELNGRTHGELVAVEPGLVKVAAPLRSTFDTMGVSAEAAEASRANLRQQLDIVAALHRAGVAIVAGTDQAVPGHSMRRELELYVGAGFTPLEAIQAATIVPARALGRDRELGTIEAGKIADFVVVDGDPLADIRAIRRISTVVTGGKAYETAALWKLIGFEP